MMPIPTVILKPKDSNFGFRSVTLTVIRLGSPMGFRMLKEKDLQIRKDSRLKILREIPKDFHSPKAINSEIRKVIPRVTLMDFLTLMYL